MLGLVVHFAVMGVGLASGVMFVLWVIHVLIKNAALVDVGWAAALGLLAAYYAGAAQGYAPRRFLLAAMVGFWSVRLCAFLLFARVIGHPEEGRYGQFRSEWKKHAALRFLFFFEFQALLAVVLSLPFLIACLDSHAALRLTEKIAAGIWLLAITAEAIADQQLSRFKKIPGNQGETCRQGLWKYSRHPNYFFDWLMWVSYAIFAIASPWGWVGILSPVLILYFLFGVTGIPATEEQALRSRGDEYRDYQRTTNAFLPWLPKKEKA